VEGRGAVQGALFDECVSFFLPSSLSICLSLSCFLALTITGEQRTDGRRSF
jgi:hypothetical protein